MNLNLTYMLNFIQIVEWGNISKAAGSLNIAQPALSRQIQSLEETLGTTLLRRHSWGVEPTEDGKLLLEHAKRIQKECVAAQQSMQSNKDNPTGTVFLGIPSAYSVTLIPPLLERMNALYPNISVRIVEAFSATIYEWLISGRLDVAMLYYSKEYDPVDTLPFIEEDLIASGSPEMLKDNPALSLSDLSQHNIIAPWRPHILRLIVERKFLTHGVPFEPDIEIDSMPTMKELAHRGAGLAILPPSAISREVADGRLAWATLHPNIRLKTVLGHTPNRQPMRAAQILMKTLRTLAEELAPTTGWSVS